MSDNVPGSDFIPGSDNVPGISDVLGIDTPSLSDILGLDSGNDYANGIDQSTAADQLGNDYANGIDQSTAADQLGNDYANGIDQSTAADQLGNGGTGTGTGTHPGTGTGTGTKTGTGNTSNSYAAFNPGFTNLTADIVGGNGAPVFNLSPTMSNVGMSQTNTQAPRFMAEGGYTEEDQHNPQFYSEGGMKHAFVQGEGDGTSDSVPAMLATGEFVIPADVVSSLGNGSSDSGASVLDQFLQTIRQHKHENGPDKLPPDSLGPLDYLSQASKKENS